MCRLLVFSTALPAEEVPTTAHDESETMPYKSIPAISNQSLKFEYHKEDYQ